MTVDRDQLVTQARDAIGALNRDTERRLVDLIRQHAPDATHVSFERFEDEGTVWFEVTGLGFGSGDMDAMLNIPYLVQIERLTDDIEQELSELASDLVPAYDDRWTDIASWATFLISDLVRED